MSKHNHGGFAQEVSHVIRQVSTLPAEEVQILYGIELLEGGKVFDPTYNQHFESVGEWAQFSVEQDMVEYDEHFTYDDGEYD
jgi:hypothetical protein